MVEVDLQLRETGTWKARCGGEMQNGVLQRVRPPLIGLNAQGHCWGYL
jgi:hypothetical protein